MRSLSRWLPLGLMLLLGVLAWLQYRWAGDLSRAERERMQAGLQSSLRRFTEGVNDELVRVFRHFLTGNETELLEAVGSWEEEGTPGIVARVYFQKFGALFEVQQGRLAKIDDPFSLETTDTSSPVFVPRGGPLVLVIPVMEPRSRWPRSRRPGRVFVELDLGYLRENVLPDRSALYLPDYDVVVRGNGELVWASEHADVTGVTDRPDASMELLSVRPPPRGARPPSSRRFARPNPLSGGPWKAFVRHRAGSLDAAVQHARVRNLSVGFGVLGVLAASIVLLALSSRRATELSNRKVEFVAGVSHELRTPLAVIRSAAQNLADGSVTTAARVERYGRLLESEVHRLENLVEQVLELAGIQSRKREYQSELVSAREVVEGALSQSKCGTARTSFPQRDYAVVADRDALERALSNLVGNAVKHAGVEGGIEVEVESRDGDVVFAVLDRGPGIPEEERQRIFEAFYRGSRALERQVPGSGLGLSLVSHIVREQGGRVSVTSRPGGGLRFEILLPEAGEAR